MSERIITVTLIDDDENYALEFIGMAADHNIMVKHNKYLQTTIEENPDLKEVEFIILDAQSIIDEEDTAPDFDFLPTALRSIDEIERKNGYYIPKCINTGYPEHVKVRRHKNNIKVFEKTTQQNELIEFIKKAVREFDIYQIKNSHKEVFEIFTKNNLAQTECDSLIALLKPLPDNISILEARDYANKIRSIQEAIYKTINSRYPEIVDNSHFDPGNNMLDFNKAKFTLSAKTKINGKVLHDKRRDLQGSDIENLSNMVYWICGNILHYNPKEFTPYLVGKYTIQSLIFALLEQLLWFKQLMHKQNQK